MGFKLDTIQQADTLQRPGPSYKKERPGDRALIVSDGTTAKVLYYIGPSLDYWFEGVSVEDCEDFDGEPPGIWIWEGKVHSGSYWTDCGLEYDNWLGGGVQPLTEGEWELLKLNDCPWDTADWLEPQEAPPRDEGDILPRDEAEGPTYKADCPQDRLLYVSDGRQALILAHIGPALDEWVRESGADLGDELCSEPVGVWVWEGTLVEDVYNTEYGTEYDVGLSAGVTRLLTKEEWERWRLTDFPWDFENWWESKEKPDEHT